MKLAEAGVRTRGRCMDESIDAWEVEGGRSERARLGTVEWISERVMPSNELRVCMPGDT